jgi:Ni/Co efflux regulator RcnB
MRRPFLLSHLLALAFASALVATPALAKDHGDEHGHGNGNDKHAQKEQEKAEKHADKQAQKERKHAEKRGEPVEVRPGAYFNDQQRDNARRYYAEHYSDARRCPPGLAKKNNGCMPPGQARK